MADRDPTDPPVGLALLIAACVVLGLCAIGVSAVVSWAVFGTVEFVTHWQMVSLLCVLDFVAGWHAEQLLRWLLKLKADQ
jgi:hypothetical protein